MLMLMHKHMLRVWTFFFLCLTTHGFPLRGLLDGSFDSIGQIYGVDGGVNDRSRSTSPRSVNQLSQTFVFAGDGQGDGGGGDDNDNQQHSGNSGEGCKNGGGLTSPGKCGKPDWCKDQDGEIQTDRIQTGRCTGGNDNVCCLNDPADNDDGDDQPTNTDDDANDQNTKEDDKFHVNELTQKTKLCTECHNKNIKPAGTADEDETTHICANDCNVAEEGLDGQDISEDLNKALNKPFSVGSTCIPIGSAVTLIPAASGNCCCKQTKKVAKGTQATSFRYCRNACNSQNQCPPHLKDIKLSVDCIKKYMPQQIYIGVSFFVEPMLLQ